MSHPEIECGWTLFHRCCVLYNCTNCTLSLRHNVVVRCTCCVHCTQSTRHNCRPRHDPERGPERSPFLSCPAGHIISSTWARPAICTYCTKYLATQLSLFVLRPGKGTRNGPLIFNHPCGDFYYFDQNKSGSPFAFCLLDPGSTCKYL